MKTKLISKIAILAVLVALIMGCSKNSMDESLGQSGKTNQSNQSFIKFENETELLKTLQELKDTSLGERKSITKLSNFYSMLDAFDEVYNLKNEEEYNVFIEKNKQFLQITKMTDDSGYVKQVVSPKVNLLFASIANTEGKLQIGDVVYNLLDKENSSKLTESLIKLLTESNASSLKAIYVSIPDYLPVLVPMTASFYFPIIYPTKYFKTTISGRTVIVQLWKGYCPGIWGYAGGVGAEVGLYYPVWWSSSLWFPDYHHCKNISYRLYLNSSNQLVFSASGYTWWLNKWRKDYYGLPMTGSAYWLSYTINGVTRYW